eukprot:5498694-Amphidinium_carterae.1
MAVISTSGMHCLAVRASVAPATIPYIPLTPWELYRIPWGSSPGAFDALGGVSSSSQYLGGNKGALKRRSIYAAMLKILVQRSSTSLEALPHVIHDSVD